MLAMRRRMREEGAAAVQRFAEDFMPLILLFAVSLTGLMLTASYTWMKGYAYTFIAILHAITVIGTFLWLPFGKFFHIFQRPAQLGVGFYKDVGADPGTGALPPLRPAFSSRMHIEDLIEVERQLGFTLRDPRWHDGHYQWICPRCRRASLAMAQGALWRGPARRRAAAATAVRCRCPSTPTGDSGRVRSVPKTPTTSIRSAIARRCTHEDADFMNGPARTTRRRRHSIGRPSREFGPHLAYASDDRLDTGVEPEKYVKTHCCFCGQQCGMQLKVKDNLVVGVEPWYEFPFNKGMMCPKGIKRYLQQAHPDRLLHAYAKDAGSPGGFRTLAYDDGDPPDRRARSIGSSAHHGNDAFALLSGASLTTEKTYLMGKFAHMCLRTANIDYNGRLCMVSAGGGQQEGVRHRSRRQPLERHPRRRRDPGQRRQHRRVRAHHHELRLAGPRAGRQGHRRGSAHHADRADLRPVPAGQAGTRHRALQRHPAPDDRARLARSAFIEQPHGRVRCGRGTRARMDAAADGRGDRHRGEGDPAGRRVVGHGEDELPLPRARHRAPQPRRARTC